jgi:hypothetical protein
MEIDNATESVDDSDADVEDPMQLPANEWGSEHPLRDVYQGGRGGRWSDAELRYIARYISHNPKGTATTCLSHIFNDRLSRPIFHPFHVIDRFHLRPGWRKVRADLEIYQ